MWYIALSIFFYLLGVVTMIVWGYLSIGDGWAETQHELPWMKSEKTPVHPKVKKFDAPRDELVQVIKGKDVSYSPRRFLDGDAHPTLVARHETQKTGILHRVITVAH